MSLSQVACVIPARLDSLRYPAKLLEKVGGVPIIAHTVSRALKAGCFSEIYCFTDSEKIGRSLKSLPCNIVYTASASNGTERIANNIEHISSPYIVNLQGDEPLFPVWGLKHISRSLIQKPSCVHVLVYFPDNITEWLEISSRMKTLIDKNGLVRGFQRRVSMNEIQVGDLTCAIQMGIYGYSKAFLRQYRTFPQSEEELRINHELLRRFDLAPIVAHVADSYSPSLDVREDLPAICRHLQEVCQ